MKRIRLLTVLLLGLLSSSGLSGQEVLRASKIHARGLRKHLPALGLPVRKDGDIDHIVLFRNGLWSGSDFTYVPPNWFMCEMRQDSLHLDNLPEPVLAIARKWMGEKPAGAVSIVYGPLGEQRFVAFCKKTPGAPGWKSIGFLIPPGGIDATRSIFSHSVSVNWIEHHTGYNLFPKLPSHLQEIIEEMTAAELLCPFQESELIQPDQPDQEIDHDQEEDFREYG